MKRCPEIPLAAVREIIANALVHRDLSEQTLGAGFSVRIVLNHEALIIESPGGLSGITREELINDCYRPAPKNQHVYFITKSVPMSDGSSVIEAEGGGVSEAIRQCVKAGLPRPLFIDTGTSFTVKMWRAGEITSHKDGSRRPALEDFSSEEKALPEKTGPRGRGHNEATEKRLKTVVSVLENERLTLQEIAARCELSERQIRYALNIAVDRQLVKRSGKGGRSGFTYSALAPS